jgi:signal transduction histidine kinase
MTRVRSRILASFGVALLVIVTGWVGVATISVSTAARDQLFRTRNILDASDKLQLALLEAENAERGFLLVHDARMLAPYDRLMSERDPARSLEDLLGMVTLAPAFATLRRDFEARRDELRAAMRLALEGDEAAAIARMSHDEELLTSHRVLQDLALIVDPELSTRDTLRLRMTTALKAGRAVVLIGSLLAFSLAVIVNLSLMRALREREVGEATIHAQAEQLQRQTASLLEHERRLGERLLAHERLTTALQLSNEELDRFAYATSHDLKAPLRGIINLVGWVEEDLGDKASPEVRRNLELARGRARRLEALIEGILAFSRAGRVRESVEVVDVGALVREIAELNAMPPTCKLTIHQLPRLVTERVPLQQVLMNLLQNAVKHGCPAEVGAVEVGAEEHGGCWAFYVRDHGPGIAAQYHERIFGVFQSLVSRDVVEGTGIGLAVVKRLVESRGGQISLESAPGEGACFRFTWPTPHGDA